jgi:hypothetical protein
MLLFPSTSRLNIYRCSSFCISSLSVLVSGIKIPGHLCYSGTEFPRSSHSPEASAQITRPLYTCQNHHSQDSRNPFLPLPPAVPTSVGSAVPLRLRRDVGAIYVGSYAHYLHSYGDVGVIYVGSYAHYHRSHGDVGASNPRPRPPSLVINNPAQDS